MPMGQMTLAAPATKGKHVHFNKMPMTKKERLAKEMEEDSKSILDTIAYTEPLELTKKLKKYFNKQKEYQGFDIKSKQLDDLQDEMSDLDN